MPDNFSSLLEKHKGLLKPEMHRLIVKNLDKLSGEDKQRIIDKLKDAAYIKKMIDEYDDQRMIILRQAADEFKKVEDHLNQQYEEARQKAEVREHKAEMESAEASLKQL